MTVDASRRVFEDVRLAIGPVAPIPFRARKDGSHAPEGSSIPGDPANGGRKCFLGVESPVEFPSGFGGLPEGNGQGSRSARIDRRSAIERGSPFPARAVMDDLLLKFLLNGRDVSVKVKPNTMLADLIRDGLGLKGTKVGCREGECGACTVIVNGAPSEFMSDAGPESPGVFCDDHRRIVRKRWPASASASLHRRGGGSVRVLYSGDDLDRQGAPGPESKPG